MATQIDFTQKRSVTLTEEQIVTALRDRAKAGTLTIVDITLDADGSAILIIGKDETAAAVAAHLLAGKLLAVGSVAFSAPADGTMGATVNVEPVASTRKPRGPNKPKPPVAPAAGG